MIYFDTDSLETFTGFATTDFKDAGIKMGATVWTTFVSQLDESVAGWMHRWCGVPTFGSHFVSEFHDGRYDSTCSYPPYHVDGDMYDETDRTFFLREPPTGDPDVYVDIASVFDVPSWQQMEARGAATGGQYIYDMRGDLGIVRFHSYIPAKGYRNVKIEYWAGFPDGSHDLETIKLIAKQIATNLLLYKKKVQESQTIRSTGVRDYAQMFELEMNNRVFTPEIEFMLTRYRRFQFDSGGFK